MLQYSTSAGEKPFQLNQLSELSGASE